MPVVRFLAARRVRVVVTSSRPTPAELEALATLDGDVTFAGDLPRRRAARRCDHLGRHPADAAAAGGGRRGACRGDRRGRAGLAGGPARGAGRATALAGDHRHQRQDDGDRHARVDPAGRRPDGDGVRQHRLARAGRPVDGRAAAGGDRRGAVELPAALGAGGAPVRGRGAQPRRGPPRLARQHGRVRGREGAGAHGRRRCGGGGRSGRGGAAAVLPGGPSGAGVRRRAAPRRPRRAGRMARRRRLRRGLPCCRRRRSAPRAPTT